MADIAPLVHFDGEIMPRERAGIAITASATLYGMSIYTVTHAHITDGEARIFRLPDHQARLHKSAAMIGMRNAATDITDEMISDAVAQVIRANAPTSDCFVRITIHAVSDVPGVRTADLKLTLSVFLYDARPILPPDGATLKTSLWRRTRDDAIPARAKVCGAYVNSCLAKQDALDAGCDDALFLNHDGFVSELTAANIFLVRDGTLITPDTSSDILEGITRRTILEIARTHDITVCERKVAITEVYTADEVFACGTSAFVTPITAIDNRPIGTGQCGPLTEQLRDALHAMQTNPSHGHLMRIALTTQ